MEKQTNWIISLWKHPVYGYIFKAILVIVLLYALDYLLGGKTDSIMKAVVYILIGLITAYLSVLQDFKEVLSNTKDEIIKITRNEIEDKIYRKLISTNAIIEQKNGKLSITARILNDFPDERYYKNKISEPTNTETIDVVRFLSYQDFLFTPKYLNYLFYRHNNSKSTKKIVVVHDEDCQATISYIFLCCKLGYETKIISLPKFKEFYIKYCNSDIEKMRMIKGNPFMFATNNGTLTYGGEYTNYQKNLTNNGEISTIPNDNSYWKLLNNLFTNSVSIQENDVATANSLKDILAPSHKSSIT